MAQELADGEFWLPPEFLNDDDFIPGKLNSGNKGCSGFGLYGRNSNSEISSPVESVLGSTETESDEEDFNLNGLTQKLNNTSLKQDLWNLDTNFNSIISENNHSKVLFVFIVFVAFIFLFLVSNNGFLLLEINRVKWLWLLHLNLHFVGVNMGLAEQALIALRRRPRRRRRR